MFSISRQISPEHLIYRLRFDQRFSNYFEDRNTRFWREVFFSEPSKRRVKQLLTFNYLSAEKWKKIDNVSLTSNKLFFIQETDHLGMRWCGSKILDHETANRVFSGQIRCNRNSGISPDFQLASPEDFTIFSWWFSLSTSSMNCFLVHQDLEEHWSFIFSWLWKSVTETDTDVSAAQAECGGQLRK